MNPTQIFFIVGIVCGALIGMTIGWQLGIRHLTKIRSRVITVNIHADPTAVEVATREHIDRILQEFDQASQA